MLKDRRCLQLQGSSHATEDKANSGRNTTDRKTADLWNKDICDIPQGVATMSASSKHLSRKQCNVGTQPRFGLHKTVTLALPVLHRTTCRVRGKLPQGQRAAGLGESPLSLSWSSESKRSNTLNSNLLVIRAHWPQRQVHLGNRAYMREFRHKADLSIQYLASGPAASEVLKTLRQPVHCSFIEH